jgi:hypothetical protein
MAAGARRSQCDPPGVDHVLIDDLGMILGQVGDEIGLHVTATVAGSCQKNGRRHHGAG